MSGVDTAQELEQWPPTPFRVLPEKSKVDPKPKVLITKCFPYWFSMLISLFKDGSDIQAQDSEYRSEKEFMTGESIGDFLRSKADAMRVDTSYKIEDFQNALKRVANKDRVKDVSISEYKKPSAFVKICNWLTPVLVTACMIETAIAGAWACLQLVEGEPVDITVPLYVRLFTIAIGGLENTPGIAYLLEGIGLCLVLAAISWVGAYYLVERYPQLYQMFIIFLPYSYILCATSRCSDAEVRDVFREEMFIDPYRYHGGIA
eukprot:gb/GECG01013557.1/.p1 GENE.gb/GECG01013557.1/~~gb/GECG01013557.1/.p1  ORF type:complete len:261 (+),score=19.24 gb/GECG01013557.1/:1-783(+)